MNENEANLSTAFHYPVESGDLQSVSLFCFSGNLIDDFAKRSGWPTSKLCTIILCNPNFAVS